jgi:hypothetical protein
LTLHEHLSFSGKHFLSRHFTLPDHRHKLPGIFQLLSEPSEFLGALRVSATSLANLPYLPSTETYIRIAIVCVCAGLELKDN